MSVRGWEQIKLPIQIQTLEQGTLTEYNFIPFAPIRFPRDLDFVVFAPAIERRGMDAHPRSYPGIVVVTLLEQ